MLSRLVITFLPRSKCLLISWLQPFLVCLVHYWAPAEPRAAWGWGRGPGLAWAPLPPPWLHSLCPVCRAGLQKGRPSACTSDALSVLTCSEAAGSRGRGWLRWGQVCRPACGGPPTARMPLCPAGADTYPSWKAPEALSLGLLSWELKSWGTNKLGACELVGTRGTGRPHTVGEAGKEVLNFCPAAGAAAP